MAGYCSWILSHLRGGLYILMSDQLQRFVPELVKMASGGNVTFALPASTDGRGVDIVVQVRGTGDITLTISASLDGVEFDDIVEKKEATGFSQAVVNLAARYIKLTTVNAAAHTLRVMVS